MANLMVLLLNLAEKKILNRRKDKKERKRPEQKLQREAKRNSTRKKLCLCFEILVPNKMDVARDVTNELSSPQTIVPGGETNRVELFRNSVHDYYEPHWYEPTVVEFFLPSETRHVSYRAKT